jgi:PAP2 superfamily/PEP-CTERM motif
MIIRNTLLSLLLVTTGLKADVITDWNAAMLQAFANQGSAATPPTNTRTLAMASAAMFDAVNSIDRSYSSYSGYYNTSGPTSAEAAAAQAAHDVLVNIFAGNAGQVSTFDTLLNTQLSAVSDATQRSNGISLGQAVASSIYASRASDGSTAASTYTVQPAGTPGAWQVPAGAGAWGSGTGQFVKSEWGYVTPFTMSSGSQFRPAAPPSLNSQAYVDAVAQVKDLGSATSSTRTADQTQIAKFWVDGPGTASPPGHWNQIASDLAQSRGLTIQQSARLFALLNLAEADTAIATWEAKRTYNLWRPVEAIQEADLVAGTAALLDVSWTPLIPTPSFPSYTSGHSGFSKAGATILADFFGTDNVAFTTGTTSLLLPSGTTRSFTSFSQAADEAGMSRIYGGIHFEFDNVAGQQVGQDVASNVYNNFLTPVPEPGSVMGIGMALGALVLRRRRVK